jgi:tetratricopeptide (TPR) repeat protein
MSNSFRISIGLSLLMLFAKPCLGASIESLFHEGVSAYGAADYERAADAFGRAAAIQPASGTLQNLGNAEWQQGQTGPAIVAWEQALWLDPFNQSARNNLRFARKVAQLESPDLAWYEVVSTWLPANWWAWIAGLSLWLAVAMTLLPSIFRRRKTAWQQAVAAMALMVFLLSLPAHAGVYTRSHIGFIVEKDTPLRLTPTADSQNLTRLAAGTPARWERLRGRFLLIQTPEGLRGWVEKSCLSAMGD